MKRAITLVALAIVALALLVPTSDNATGQTSPENESSDRLGELEAQLQDLAKKIDDVLREVQVPKVDSLPTVPTRAPQHVVEWITKAKDQLESNLGDLMDRRQTLRNAVDPTFRLPDQAAMARSRLTEIERRQAETGEQLEEARYRLGILEARSARLEEQKEVHLAALKRLVKFQAEDERIKAEIRRKENLYDSVVNQLNDIRLTHKHGAQP